RHLERDVIWNPGRIGGAKERSNDLALRDTDLRLSDLLVFGSCESAVFLRLNFEPAADITAFMASARRMIVAQRYQPTFVIQCGANYAARVQLIYGAGRWVLHQKRLQARLLYM